VSAIATIELLTLTLAIINYFEKVQLVKGNLIERLNNINKIVLVLICLQQLNCYYLGSDRS
jgi:hypothetical protein